MGGPLLVVVGTLNREVPYFKGARGPGLAVYTFDPQTEAIGKVAESDIVENPTFLSVTPDGTRIYANSEMAGWPEGKVTALALDRDAGNFRAINQRSALGSITAHNAITRDGTKLLVANYGEDIEGPDQSVVVFGIGEDGALTEALDAAGHEGSGPNPERQTRSHAHSATETLSGSLVLVADLGIDSVTAYRLGHDGTLDPIAETVLKPGSGPRHVALHPNGRLVAVLNELDSTLVTLSLDSETGSLTYLDSMPMVPQEVRDTNACSDIQISPDGRFLYGANRGHDSVSIFAVDGETGKLKAVGMVPSGGETPRNLCLTPSGGHLFIANQNGDRISIYRRDAESGRVYDSGASILIGTPMCVKIV